MNKFKKMIRLALLAIIPAAFIAGCSSTAKVSAPSAELARYKFNETESYKYRQESTMDQLIIYMVEEMGATVSSTIEFSIKPGESVDGITELGITIDTLGISVKSIQGDFVTAAKELKGKQFNIKLSETGKETGLDQAANVKYMVAGQEANLKSTFSMFFPDLPSEAIMPGYTWSQTDTVDMSAGSESATMIIISNNTVTGRETLNGYDCFVITGTFTGTRESVSNTPQGSISSSGDITGSGTIYFAPKEGLLVKDSNKVKVDGSLLIPTGEALPMIIDSEYVTVLVR